MFMKKSLKAFDIYYIGNGMNIDPLICFVYAFIFTALFAWLVLLSLVGAIVSVVGL